MTTRNPQLYFAYGSNLNPEDLAGWCQRHARPAPTLRLLGQAYAPDRERVFDWFSPGRGGGVLNLAHRPGQVTPGGLYALEEDDWITLDLKEGVASGHYQPITLPVLTGDGREHSAITYVVSHSSGRHVPPTAHYLQVVLDGLSLLGFDPASLHPAARGEPCPWEIDRLFIYGTLRRGGDNRSWLDREVIHAEQPGETAGTLYDLGAFPGLHLAPAGRVRGELLHLAHPDHTLAHLDQLEGFDGFGKNTSLFHRAILPVRTRSGTIFPAWAYIHTHLPPLRNRIISGDWFNHGRRKP